jgi:hypothetical protein
LQLQAEEAAAAVVLAELLAFLLDLETLAAEAVLVVGFTF